MWIRIPACEIRKGDQLIGYGEMRVVRSRTSHRHYLAILVEGSDGRLGQQEYAWTRKMIDVFRPLPAYEGHVEARRIFSENDLRALLMNPFLWPDYPTIALVQGEQSGYLLDRPGFSTLKMFWGSPPGLPHDFFDSVDEIIADGWTFAWEPEVAAGPIVMPAAVESRHGALIEV